MNLHDDVRVRAWLDDLEIRLRDLPPSDRRDIVDDLRSHLDEVLAGPGEPDDPDPVRTALRRLGDPEAIAHQAYEEARLTTPGPQRRLGITEILALILLPIGSLLIPILGWIVGVILLWVSDAWTRGQKIAGMLLPPLGLAFPLFGGLFLLRLPQSWVTGTCSASGSATSSGTNLVTSPFTCTGGGWAPTTILITLVVLAAAATLLAVIVPIRLGQKARSPFAR